MLRWAPEEKVTFIFHNLGRKKGPHFKEHPKAETVPGLLGLGRWLGVSRGWGIQNALCLAGEILANQHVQRRRVCARTNALPIEFTCLERLLLFNFM